MHEMKRPTSFYFEDYDTKSDPEHYMYASEATNYMNWQTSQLKASLQREKELRQLLGDAISMVTPGFHKRRLNLKLIQIYGHAAVTGE